jgi:hypothetical protein
LLGTAHAVHDEPQLSTLVLLAQLVPQTWKPVLQLIPQEVPLQVAEPLLGTGQAVHDDPQLLTLVLLRHAVPQA